MLKKYSNEKNVQILMALLKAHNIKNIVVSPGATNISFVASCQQDSFFKMYSCVDERSAAYIACGIAAECGEPVVLTCTGATASRNYLSGLTEAYYRKLPILAVTSSRPSGWIGHNIQQVTDRRNPPPDTVRMSAQIPILHDKDEEWAYTTKMNEAILELNHRGGGPVHINLETAYSYDFSVEELPEVAVINRICPEDEFPVLEHKKIAVFVGEHKPMSRELTEAVDAFCAKYDAVVLCDQTSNYRGKYRVLASMVCNQRTRNEELLTFDTIINIGDVTGATLSMKEKEVWRISVDGEVRDMFRRLRYVFEMSELAFFRHYAEPDGEQVIHTEQLEKWNKENERLYAMLPELPLSNMWVAQQTISRLPENSVLHMGIYNSLRSWSFFESPESINCYCNTGGYGIDGNISTLLGAAIASPDKLCFIVVGDLSFFYDMNVLGNRHIAPNMRIIVINNGKGTEFRQHINRGYQFEEATDEYIAAAGHYGNKSEILVRHYAEDLGFEYLSASNKEDCKKAIDRFVTTDNYDKPMLFEVFTESNDEDMALLLTRTVNDPEPEIDRFAKEKQMVKNVLGENGVKAVKKILGR